MNKEEQEYLIEQKKAYQEIKSEVVKIFEPRLFELTKENSTNVRNTIIVCTTLATINLIILDSAKLGQFNLTISLFSTLFFVSSIIFYSYYLMRLVGDSIKTTEKTLDRQIGFADDGQKIIDDATDGKISIEEVREKQISLYEKIRESVEDVNDDKKTIGLKTINFCAKSGNLFFILGIFLTCINLIQYLICSV